jgi:hypothetical protein
MRITIVNAGRRPLVVRLLVAIPEDGNWFGDYLGDYKTGLRLGEHEHHEIIWRRQDVLGGPVHDRIAVDLEVEDSLGRRYPVRDAKKNLQSLLVGAAT